VAPSSARRRGTLGAFRRPFFTYLVFWIAAGLSIAIALVISAVLVALGGRVPDSLLGWGVAVFIFVIAGWLSFKLLAMGLNTSRALEETHVADEKRAASLESKGRTAGALAGRGAASLMTRGKKKPAAAAPAAPPPPTAAAPAPAAAEEARPDLTVDKAARVLGSMVGRRLTDRRKDGS
jgi:hypothetical protein